MESSERNKCNTYAGTKSFILQSLRMLITETDLRNKPYTSKIPSLKSSLKGVQSKLKEQLLEGKQVLDKKLKSAKVLLRKATKHREEVGRRLYDLQQKLVKQQCSFQRATNDFQIVATEHAKVKVVSDRQKEIHLKTSLRKESVADCMRRSELKMKKLSKHLWAMDVLEEKMKDEIALQKQITYTTEKSIKEVEKDKKKQDMLIGSFQLRKYQLHKRERLLKH